MLWSGKHLIFFTVLLLPGCLSRIDTNVQSFCIAWICSFSIDTVQEPRCYAFGGFYSLPFAPTLHHRADFSVSWSFTDGRTSWTGDQLVERPLSKHRTIQTQKNVDTHQTSMPWVGYKPTIPASERAKTVHASDRSATMTGVWRLDMHIYGNKHLFFIIIIKVQK
jgi:hypothetical protein